MKLTSFLVALVLIVGLPGAAFAEPYSKETVVAAMRANLARVGAIKRRREYENASAAVGDLRVFFDGRDPELKGAVLPLPRRERRILEYLVNNRGKRVSKAQIFNSIYGLFDDNVEENVVESHISKLRKKLRRQLGYDPINSVRYLGYRLDDCV